MTRLTRTHAWLAFAAISLLLVSSANAQSTARIVRLSYVNGDVQMDRGQGAGLDRALLNLPVIQGSRIVTANGEAEVELEDGSTVRVAPSSDVTFPVLALRNGGGTDSVVLVTHGTAYIEFFHRDGAEMTLALPGRVAICTGGAGGCGAVHPGGCGPKCGPPKWLLPFHVPGRQPQPWPFVHTHVPQLYGIQPHG